MAAERIHRKGRQASEIRSIVEANGLPGDKWGTNYFWQGEKVRLRPLRIEDAEQSFVIYLDSPSRQLLQLGIELPTSVELERTTRLHKKLGFLEEGRRRRQVFFNGEYRDDVLFGTTREEFDAQERGST